MALSCLFFHKWETYSRKEKPIVHYDWCRGYRMQFYQKCLKCGKIEKLPS